MVQHMRLVTIDLEQMLSNITFDGLDEAQKARVSALGLPGAQDLFNDDPDRAKAAAREFAASFLGVDEDDE
jgi:hypothetical protein